jgi:hypothetical protein
MENCKLPVTNFKLLISMNYQIGESLNREIIHYSLSFDSWGVAPNPTYFFCLDAKKYAKKIKTASPHRPDCCLFAKRQITRRLAAAQTACLLPDGTLAAQIGCPDDEMRSGK